ncbi:MAG: trypsin-like peptidase domain-containing protein [Chloroflexota bacterium]|nr:trypsin-like peptidase domain-containing protein [Chloroflexota bacterium]
MTRMRVILAVLILALGLLAGCTGTTTSTPTPTPTATLTASTTSYTALPSITEVVEAVKPAVASVVVGKVGYNIFLQPVPQEAAGSGFIIDEAGYIVTNNHVVRGAETISVTLPDGRSFDASLVGADPLSDLAVIKIEGQDLPVVSFGDSASLGVGEWVIAIGNALGLPGGPTVTVGVVSAVGRILQESTGVTLYDLVQTDAAINPGNSGGPLVNLKGEVVGINTAKIAAVEVSGVGFAVSSNTARGVTEELIARGYVTRPYLGVSMVTVTPTIARNYSLAVDEGALVSTLASGSPADRSGLRVGDVIVAIGDEAVATADDAVLAIRAHEIGDRVSITYYRGSSRRTTTATLVERAQG